MRKALLLAVASATIASAPVAMAQTFSPDVRTYVWDLDQQYPTDSAWAAELERARRAIAGISTMRGRAGRGPAHLADVLDAVSRVRGIAGKMATIGLLQSEIDTSSDRALARRDAATGLEVDAEAAVAWLDAEVRAIGHDRIRQWLASEPRLERHKRRLHRIFYDAQFLPPDGSETALAAMERWPRSMADAVTALTESELGWPTIEEAGRLVRIDPDAYNRLRRSPDKQVRDAANAAFLAKLRDLEEPLGLLLARRVEGDLAIAKPRNLNHTIDAAMLLRDAVPAQSWRTMLEVARSSRPAMIRAAQLLKRVHRTENFVFGDFYARHVAPPRQILVPEAINIAAAAFAPLGEEYRRDLLDRLSKPWMHLPPGPNKSGTVGVFWQVGGGHPYSLITYTNDHIGSLRFAQAAMLMMWLADIPSIHTPDRREEDPPIHANAVWYVGRMLHDDELLKRTTDRDQRIAMLVDHLYFLWGNYFQNAATAQLERDIADGQTRGNPLTGAQMSARHLQHLRSFYGHDAGGAQIPDIYATQWMTHWPLFYSHTQIVWTIAIAEAALWAERIKVGDPQAIEGMRLTITPEGSQYSGDLMRAIGIDPGGREMHEALIRRFNATLDRLENELAVSEPRSSGP